MPGRFMKTMSHSDQYTDQTVESHSCAMSEWSTSDVLSTNQNNRLCIERSRTVLDALLEQYVRTLLTRFPPWRDAPLRRNAVIKFGKESKGVV
jgi:hypothetical protein